MSLHSSLDDACVQLRQTAACAAVHDAVADADHGAREDLGLDDVLDADGVLVIEWPERILPALPAERLWVELARVGEGQRRLGFAAEGSRFVDVLGALVAEGLAHAAGD